MDLNLSSRHASRLIFFEKLGSTNEYLINQAAIEQSLWPDGSVVCAATQTEGRGRNQRQWESPPGASLACSILIRNPQGAAHWYGILLAMAAAKALSRQEVAAGLKWPNDVLVDGKKIAGVLGQAAKDYLVVGIGLNLKPVNIEGSVSLQDLELNQDFDFQLAAILAEFETLRGDYQLHGVTAILEDLRDISHTLGQRVKVTTESGTLQGLATGIDSEGRLVLNHDQKISAGDILHLRGTE